MKGTALGRTAFRTGEALLNLNKTVEKQTDDMIPCIRSIFLT